MSPVLTAELELPFTDASAFLAAWDDRLSLGRAHVTAGIATLNPNARVGLSVTLPHERHAVRVEAYVARIDADGAELQFAWHDTQTKRRLDDYVALCRALAHGPVREGDPRAAAEPREGRVPCYCVRFADPAAFLGEYRYSLRHNAAVIAVEQRPTAADRVSVELCVPGLAPTVSHPAVVAVLRPHWVGLRLVEVDIDATMVLERHGVLCDAIATDFGFPAPPDPPPVQLEARRRPSTHHTYAGGWWGASALEAEEADDDGGDFDDTLPFDTIPREGAPRPERPAPRWLETVATATLEDTIDQLELPERRAPPEPEPERRQPAWSGSLEDTPTADVLTRLGFSKENGKLELAMAGRTTEIDLVAGRVVRIAMPWRPGGRLGAIFVEQGRLTEVQVAAALADARARDIFLGQALIQADLVSTETLTTTLARQLRERLAGLMALQQGEFAYTPRPRPAAGALLPGFQPAEFALRHFESRYAKRTLVEMRDFDAPYRGGVVRWSGPADVIDQLGLNEAEVALGERLVEGRHRVPEVYGLTGLTPRSAHAMVHALERLELVTFEHPA